MPECQREGKSSGIRYPNAPYAPTGYGVQTALFGPLLNEDWELAISCFYGLEAAPAEWHGITLLPGLGGNFGEEFLPLHAKHWGQGDPRNCLTMTLMDVWVMPKPMVDALGGNMVCWTPIDHDPIPPGVRDFFANNPGAIPMAMSRFGQEQLADFSPLYCPHGVNTDSYKAIPKKMAREAMGIRDDTFVCGWIAANKGRAPSRKGFQFGLEAWKRFVDKHPNSLLYMHTSLKPNWMQGENLMELCEALEIPRETLMWTNQYRLHFEPANSHDMAAIISSFDCLMNPTMGGGFEITNLEAAACGVPTITTDYTAMPESAGPTPWKVGGRKLWTAQGSFNLMADPDEIYDALEECWAMPSKQRRALARRLRHHAEKFEVKRVYEEHMRPSLKKAEKRIRRTQVSFDVSEGLDAKVPKRKPATDSPSISIVTPWMNHPELAEDYWKAVGGENVHEVIIIDNGSSPAIVGADAHSPLAGKDQVIRLDENVGFSPANNIGLAAATGEAVLFLNNDIALGVPGWLETIRSELKPGVLVGAERLEAPHASVDGETIPYLEGWCLAGMREDFERLGGWDEDLEEPSYYSDNELCFRATLAGFNFAAVAPPLIHLENVTAGPAVGKVTEVTRRNYEKFAEKVRAAKVLA